MIVVTQMARSITHGDLTYRIDLDVENEIAMELKASMNKMTESLETMAVKVSQVARETYQGNLGGQTYLGNDVGGAWKVRLSLQLIN